MSLLLYGQKAVDLYVVVSCIIVHHTLIELNSLSLLLHGQTAVVSTSMSHNLHYCPHSYRTKQSLRPLSKVIVSLVDAS